MNSKRRKKNSEITISLFSFQDIITCLSGIMILLVLLITVDIVTGKLDMAQGNLTETAHKVSPASTTEESLEQEIEHLKKKQIHSERELSKHQNRLKELNQQLLKLEKQEQSLSMRKRGISFIPAKDANPYQRAILIECSGESIKGESRSFSANTNGIREFIQYLENLNKLVDYPVFIIKPSASNYVMQLIQQVQSMGFDAGYDAMVEDENISFGQKGQ